MDFSNVTTPVRVNLLISFMDIQGFAKIAQRVQDLNELFDLLNQWAVILITEVEAVRGRAIKFIGDSCLSIFPEDGVDGGVHALLSAKQKAEAFLQKRGFTNRMRVTAHFGEAVIGLFGTSSCKGIDVFGDSVNISAALERGDHRGQMILSPQAFRKLAASSRKRFHKHTPPIVYIAEDQ